MTRPAQNLLLRGDEPRTLPAVPPGVEYHRVLAGERRRVGRGVLAIVLLAVGLIGFAVALDALATLIETRVLGRTGYTWVTHAAAMLGLAALIPWSMLIQRWLYGVPAASLHSVSGRLRFGLIGRALLLLAPFWFLITMVGFLVPGEQVPWAHADLVGILVVSVLLTPLQAAGEEYGVRGLMLRVVGSWTRSSRVGLVLAVVLTSAVFAAVHGSADPYIAGYYFVYWSCLAIITWRTGGLEVAIVLHAVSNTLTFVAAGLLRIDLGGALSSRGEIAGTPMSLVPGLVVAAITVVVCLVTRRTGPARTGAGELSPAGAPAAARR